MAFVYAPSCTLLSHRHQRPLNVSTFPAYNRYSSFAGRPLEHPAWKSTRRDPSRLHGCPPTTMALALDPWSVSPDVIDQLAAQLFATSLFPYLAFLYFISKKEIACPPLANFGFRFLLVFVAATIPAGIYAKIVYHDILANVDWLHGSAESFLTITNFLIVLGFRNGIAQKQLAVSTTSQDASGQLNQSANAANKSPASVTAIATCLYAVSMVSTLALSLHAEPSNALSLPTWIIHVSSLFEWLAAMGLVWQYSNITGNSRWKGLVWGMVPLHTSGLCACTYHLFYNAPALNTLVAIQAGLTCIGNTTMAAATWRITQPLVSAEASPKNGTPVAKSESQTIPAVNAMGNEDSNLVYFAKVFVVSTFVSILVKWGSLSVDWPFDPQWSFALAWIGVPTTLNILKWTLRSRKGSDSSQFDRLI